MRSVAAAPALLTCLLLAGCVNPNAVSDPPIGPGDVSLDLAPDEQSATMWNGTAVTVRATNVAAEDRAMCPLEPHDLMFDLEAPDGATYEGNTDGSPDFLCTPTTFEAGAERDLEVSMGEYAFRDGSLVFEPEPGKTYRLRANHLETAAQSDWVLVRT